MVYFCPFFRKVLGNGTGEGMSRLWSVLAGMSEPDLCRFCGILYLLPGTSSTCAENILSTSSSALRTRLVMNMKSPLLLFVQFVSWRWQVTLGSILLDFVCVLLCFVGVVSLGRLTGVASSQWSENWKSVEEITLFALCRISRYLSLISSS